LFKDKTYYITIVPHILTPIGGTPGSWNLNNLIPARAKGGFNSTPTTALTGEEDPEIVWNKEKGYAYIAGLNGPEFHNLNAGDQVFNAEETRKILRNSKNN
jgi:hypothetical protein